MVYNCFVFPIIAHHSLQVFTCMVVDTHTNTNTHTLTQISQFPGSEHLPWSGEGIINGLFERHFSFNSNSFTHNNLQDGGGHSQGDGKSEESGISGRNLAELLSQMRSSPSPPAPKPYSGPVKQDKHSFPESGGIHFAVKWKSCS